MVAAPKTYALIGALGAGTLVGLQARLNGQLGVRLHSSLEAAAASFVTGLFVVALVAPFRRAGFARLRRASIKRWWWFSGLGGAFVVAATAHGVPEIGVALVSVCVVAGTTAGGLLTDQFGLGPSGRHAATFWRFVGVAVVIGAVAIGAVGDRGAALRPLLFVVLFLAGAGSAVQQGANGQLNKAVDDVVVASFISFVGGTVALVIVVVATGEFSVHSWPAAPWLYLGGPLGLVYVLVGATTVRRLGVLRFVLAAVSGQLLSSVVLDAVWPESGTTLRLATVIGAVVTVIGVWVSGRGGPHRAPEQAALT